MKFETIKKTFAQVRKKPLSLFFPVLLDFLAMLFFGYTLLDVQRRALDVVGNLNSLLQQSLNTTMKVLNESNTAISFAQQQDLASLEWALLKLVFILLISFWIMWMVLQGGSWKLASSIAEKKTKLWRFLGRFITISILWLSVLSIINLFILRHQFGLQIEFHKTGMDLLTIIALFFNIVTAYFMMISYSLLGGNKTKDILKKTFQIGILRFPQVFLSYLFVLAGFIVIDMILRLAGLIGNVFMLITGVITLLPYITVSRIYLINSIEEIDRKRIEKKIRKMEKRK